MFDKIRVGNTSRSTFDLSHHQVTTSDFGYLIPICVREMVPNDDFVVTPRVFTRLAPLAAPTYGRIYCRVHHFFVPNRILFPHFDAWITGDTNNHYVPPYFKVSNLKSALQDDKAFSATGTKDRGFYSRVMGNLGLNPRFFLNNQFNPAAKVNAFPFLAYYRLWIDWFMDANIYPHTTVSEFFKDAIKNGGDISSLITAEPYLLATRNVCFKKDYFTTAKINPQDGSASHVNTHLASATDNPGLSNVTSDTALQMTSQRKVKRASGTNPNDVLSSFTIEALRAANSLQKYLERNNYVGSRLINRILAHFGIEPTPERLDMAEFIGGDSFPIQIADVTSTAFSSADYTGLGIQAGKGVGAGAGKQIRYHAKEHGVFMSVMSILPDTGYYQGLHRMWTRGVHGDYLDYYTPEFENLGYQEVLNSEVYVPDDVLDYSEYDAEGIFGYTPRYSEYKFQNDVLGGDFLTGVDAQSGFSLDSFHLFRKMYYDDESPLALNENFVECNNLLNDYDRIFQYTDQSLDHFYFNIDVDVKATRPMTGFAEPSLDNNNSSDGNSVTLPYGGNRL